MANDATQAQVLPPISGAVEPGERPRPEAPPQPDFDFSIEAPQRSALPRAVDEIHFHLNDIRIAGAATLPAERFRPLYRQLLGKDVTLTDIFNVADGIEAEYRSAGYLLTRAFVPPQRVNDGVFTITVVEGYVATAAVEGGSPTAQARIKSFVEPILSDKPLRLTTMERALLLANDLPGVSAAGLLRPSPDMPGASDLIVTVVEEKPSFGLSLSNRGSHYSGVWTLTGDFAVAQLLGDEDQLSGNIVGTPGNFERRIGGQLRYRRPIGAGALAGSLVVSVVHGQPGSTLQFFHVLTDSWAVGPRLTYPLRRTRADTLLLEGGVTVQEAKVKILGLQLSHDRWRVADMGLSYSRTGFLGGAWTTTLDVAQGLPLAGASRSNAPELSRPGAALDFTKLTATVRHNRLLTGAFSLAFAAQAQYAFAPLITGEAISFGATQIGRGYDPGAITGDHGIGGSVELRYDRRWTQFFIQAIQPYIFVDAAKVWSIHTPAALTPSLTSTGAGIRLSFPYNIAAALEVATTLRSVPGSDGGKRTTKLALDAAVRF